MKSKQYKVLGQVTLALLSFLMFSCQGELDETITSSNTTTSLLTFEEHYYQLTKATAPGTMLIQSNRNLANQNNEINIDISEKPGASDKIVFLDQNNKPFNILGINSDSKKLELYGKDHSFSYKGTNYKVYAPKMVTATISTIDKLGANSLLSWNPDKLNKNGVVIWVTYKPTNQRDMNIIDKNRTYILHGIVVEDTGAYSLTKDDLAQFPSGAVVDINIARFGYTILTAGQPSAVFYSVVTHEAVIN
jgi:hypothetical protein